MAKTKKYWLKKGYKSLSNSQCFQCNKLFWYPSNQKQKFCSYSCNTCWKNLHNNPMKNKGCIEKMRQKLIGKIPWQKKLNKENHKLILYKKKMSKQQSILRKGKKSWNKNLTKEMDSRIKGSIREKNPMWKGGRILSKGYIYLLTEKGRYSLEHHIVWKKRYGIIPKGYIIHHKNGIKTDNRINNLQLMTHSQHSTHHNTERWNKK